MNNKQWIHAWGRKYFYSIGWAFFSLIALNYHQSLIYPQSLIGWIYYLVTFIGHYGLLVSCTYYLIYRPLVAIFPYYKFARIWSLLILMICCLLLFVDSMIFAQYRFHLNGFIFDLLLGGAAQDIFDFPIITYFIVGGGIFILGYLMWLLGSGLWANIHKKFSPTRIWYFMVILVCLLSSHGLHIYGSAVGERAITGLVNLFPFHFPLTANRFLKKRGWLPAKAETRLVENKSNDFYYPHGEMKCEGSQNKNILFIIVDSWRSDEMNEEVTPHLHQYANDSLLLTNHYSGSNNTRGGIFSIFYAIPATYWDIALNNQTPPVFMDELRARNYSMGIFAAASLISPEFDRTVFAKVPNLRISTEGNNSAIKDRNITSEWLQWLDSHTKASAKPFFGMLFYDSPHSYIFPPDFKKEFNPIAKSMNYLALTNSTETLPYLNRHKKSVSYVDSLIHEVMEDLKKKSLVEDTIIVITGDHGQEINDNKKNYWGHNSNYSPIQTKVPTLILWPGKSPEVKEILTTHYDLVPTIMKEHWKCQNPSNNFSYGDNVFTKQPSDSVIVASYLDYGVLDLQKKIIMTVDPMGRYTVTDLQLNELPKKSANEELIFQVFKDLNKFKKKLPGP